MGVLNTLVVRLLPVTPKFVVGRVARRYVAGEALEDAVAVIKDLNSKGIMATCDVLGEESQSLEKADWAVEEYFRVLDAISTHGLDSNISVKPTLLGLRLGEEECYSRLRRVVKRAKELGNFVRIDMEDRTTTDATIRMFEELHSEFGNVGVVLQAYLHRTPSDIRRLLPLKPNVRLCKGIYREPRKVSWKLYESVRASFVACMESLIAGGAYPAIATHDEYLVAVAYSMIEKHNLRRHQYEFQMLLGVDEELRASIVEDGHRMRVYVPYGRDWYPYSTRRLRENPQIATHVIRAFFGLGQRSARA